MFSCEIKEKSYCVVLLTLDCFNALTVVSYLGYLSRQSPEKFEPFYQSSFASFSLKLKSRFGRTMTLALLNDKNRNIFNLKTLQGFPILVLENERQIRYLHKPFSKIIISQLLISYSFWRSYLTGRVWSPFPHYDLEFDMETDVFA